MQGSVVAGENEPSPTAVRIVVKRTGQTQKTILAPVSPQGRWSASIPLTPGESELTFAAVGAPESARHAIVFNPGYAFGGPLQLDIDVAYANESSELTALIPLPDLDTDPASVEVVQVSGSGETSVAVLTDDGNLANGDEIAGDRIYTARWSLTPTEPGATAFRVLVGRLGTSVPARSERQRVLVRPRIDPIEMAAIIDLQTQSESQLNQAANFEVALEQVVADLRAHPLVSQADTSDGRRGIWCVYTNGIAGIISPLNSVEKGGGTERDPGRRRDSIQPRHLQEHAPLVQHTPTHALAGSSNNSIHALGTEPDNKVESNKAIAIAAQFFDWGNSDDVPAMAQVIEDESCFELTYAKDLTSGTGSVENFKGLGQYGVVLVSSHGDSFYNGILNLWTDQFGWNWPFGQVVVHSNMAATPQNQSLYQDDLQHGRLVLWTGGSGTHFGMLPSFFSRYSGVMPNSLVYMSICRGSFNGTLAQAFLSSGAGAFFGYSDYVQVPFTQSIGPDLMRDLLVPGNTIDDVFVPGLVETDATPAEFRHYGAFDLSLDVEGLIDGSFESGSIQQAWSVAGDARIISGLGSFAPTEGALMAVISTGLGFTVSNGEMTQSFCLSPNATTIEYRWNFISEEFLEWVGSIFQDSFTVTMSEVDQPGNSTVLMHVFVDSLASSVFPVDITFDQGDVYATGWQSFTANVPAQFLGKHVEPRFAASDVGDSIYDTAVLIDAVQLIE